MLKWVKCVAENLLNEQDTEIVPVQVQITNGTILEKRVDLGNM